VRLKKQGRLPPFTRKISPPGYWKDRLLGKRRLIVIIRSDRYYIEKMGGDWGYIVL
jgi:putative transposase